MYDVAIAGASVAGAATAIGLARRGRSVVLLDRRERPGEKACGEGLFPAGVAALRDLGVLEEAERQAGTLTGVRFHAGGAVARAGISLEGATGLGVQRGVLGSVLLQAAIEAGVTFQQATVTGLEVEGGAVRALRTRDAEVEARTFVAADGLHSPLRREAGLANGRTGGRYGVTGHVQVGEETGDTVEVFFEQGYELYLTPVGGRCLNVALLLRKREMGRFGGDLERAFRGLLEGHRAFRGGFTLIDGPRVAGPFPVGCRRAWRGNLLLAGDAAGFYDGVTGEGMSVALVSAGDAAEALDGYLRDGSREWLRGYDRRRRALARNSDLLARVSLTLGRWPWLAEYAVGNLGKRPGTFDRLTAVNTGEAGLGSLRVRDVPALLLGV